MAIIKPPADFSADGFIVLYFPPSLTRSKSSRSEAEASPTGRRALARSREGPALAGSAVSEIKVTYPQ